MFAFRLLSAVRQRLLMESGLYAMGVFEQQHCNYEHLFGQALFGVNVDLAPTEGQKGENPYLFSVSWLSSV